MTTIVDFISARLDEIEAPARALDGQEWTDRDGVVMGDRGVIATGAQGDLDAAEATHIARHDPAYELKKVAADRAILTAHPVQLSLVSDYSDCAACMDVDAYDSYPCKTVRLLASPFDQHPDYQGEWAP